MPKRQCLYGGRGMADYYYEPPFQSSWRTMTNTTEVTNLPLSDIKADKACQSRDAINLAIIDEYTEVMKEKGDDRFPAVVVFHDGTDYWLSEGFHRHAAAKEA